MTGSDVSRLHLGFHPLHPFRIRTRLRKNSTKPSLRRQANLQQVEQMLISLQPGAVCLVKRLQSGGLRGAHVADRCLLSLLLAQILAVVDDVLGSGKRQVDGCSGVKWGHMRVSVTTRCVLARGSTRGEINTHCCE